MILYRFTRHFFALRVSKNAGTRDLRCACLERSLIVLVLRLIWINKWSLLLEMLFPSGCLVLAVSICLTRINIEGVLFLSFLFVLQQVRSHQDMQLIWIKQFLCSRGAGSLDELFPFGCCLFVVGTAVLLLLLSLTRRSAGSFKRSTPIDVLSSEQFVVLVLETHSD